MSSFPVSNLRSEPLPLWHKIDNRHLWKNVTKLKRVRGTKVALRRGTWVIRKWQEDWIRVWGFWASDFKIIQPRKRKECSESFCKQNHQQRVDWFSHNSPLHIFYDFRILPGFQHILNLQNCFVSEGATQDSSLSLWASDTEVWRFIWSVSQPGSEDRLYLQPGSEPVCIWADPVSPCQKGLITDNNLCEPIFLPLLE